MRQTEFIQIKQGVSVTWRSFRLFYFMVVFGAIAFLPRNRNLSDILIGDSTKTRDTHLSAKAGTIPLAFLIN
ncbi:hypothetical protein IQ244_19275 [Nostoc sp. LEGE 06077]|uniref:hypothetical protein n=1 Tax=Nostoc sp. LEGE 06077 TaxID=915325 RepID=UPI00187F071B|nr:hypothetical protein [Nostoc sp. LEGE 06077]MBE9208640.1 hypothetical protein [Nostoc sp. LEGE 06077]